MNGLRIASALAAAAIAGAPIAAAAPDDGSWDIEAYDDCMSKTVRNADLCCVDSGGVPTSDPNDTQSDGSPNCYAPPAQAQQAESVPAAPLLPGVVIGERPGATAVAPPAPGPMPTFVLAP